MNETMKKLYASRSIDGIPDFNDNFSNFVTRYDYVVRFFYKVLVNQRLDSNEDVSFLPNPG